MDLAKTPITPLPKRQLSILLFLRFAESTALTSIDPYLNQFLKKVTGGDETKVGYFAGILKLCYYTSETLTVLQWSRLSDHLGRKPVLCLGLVGVIVSMVCLGLSTTFVSLVISRCILAVTNGNYGIINSTIGDITDTTNRAGAFALFPISWALGASIGAFLGGSLSNPHRHFPSVFGNAFWKRYPYLLPCIPTIGLVTIALAIALRYFNETVATGFLYQHVPKDREGQLEPLLARTERPLDNEREFQPHDQPIPLRELLTPRVLIPVFNYASITLLETSFQALQPLVLAMSVEVGGLGLSPRTIGYILGSYGAVNGVFQALFLPRIMRTFGVKRVFVCAILAFIPIFLCYPVMNLLARQAGVSGFIFFLVACQLSFLAIVDLGYSSIYMYITSASPNKRSLGSTLSGTLLALSIEHKIGGGYGVYFGMVGIVLLSLVLAIQLPQELPLADDE